MSEDRIINEIAEQVKAQGMFDNFRKQCLQEIESNNSYSRLAAEVNKVSERYLNGTQWHPGMKKNELKADLRRHFENQRFIDREIDRILSKCLSPAKVDRNFFPEVERVAMKYLGIPDPNEIPVSDSACDAKPENEDVDIEVADDPGTPVQDEPCINTLSGDVLGEGDMDLDEVQEELAEYNPNEHDDLQSIQPDDSASQIALYQQSEPIASIPLPAQDYQSDHAVSGSPEETQNAIQCADSRLRSNSDAGSITVQVEMDLESVDSNDEQKPIIITQAHEINGEIKKEPSVSPVPSPPRPSSKTPSKDGRRVSPGNVKREERRGARRHRGDRSPPRTSRFALNRDSERDRHKTRDAKSRVERNDRRESSSPSLATRKSSRARKEKYPFDV